MYNMKKMISGLFAAAVLVSAAMFIFAPAVAQEPSGHSAAVRAAKHKDFIRIVITADAAVVKSSSAVLDKNKIIVIDIGAAGGSKTIALQTEKGLMRDDMSFELIKTVTLAKRGSSWVVTVPNVRDIKVSKLQSPSRMVIDAYVNAPQGEEAVQAAAFKALTDQISLKSFVIDAGHGGYDYGKKGSRFSEKDFVLAFSRDLAGILSKNGRDVQLTRKTDMLMTLAERIGAANKRMPDLFISFHISPTKAPAVYVLPDRIDDRQRASGPKRRDVAKSISDAIAKNIEKEFSVSVRRENLPLPLLMKIKSPAIMVDLPSPDEFSYEKKNRDRMLSAIIKGLAAAAREDRLGTALQKPEASAEKKPDKNPESNNVSAPEKTPEAAGRAADSKGKN
jgi:N-acetylmuramoyl-L-alanine amidase